VGVDCTLSEFFLSLSPTPYQSLRQLSKKRIQSELNPFLPCHLLILPIPTDYYQSGFVTLNTEVFPQNAWYCGPIIKMGNSSNQVYRPSKIDNLKQINYVD